MAKSMRACNKQASKHTMQTVIITADMLQCFPGNPLGTVRSPDDSLVLAVPLYILCLDAAFFIAFFMELKPFLIPLPTVTLQT